MLGFCEDYKIKDECQQNWSNDDRSKNCPRGNVSPTMQNCQTSFIMPYPYDNN